ncbi:hypothetical protein BK010_04815 [Tenericutes bacterium MO-XQ]|nr:hypothetical protein BK010_04815 [Tenericutes bacterium MO-XQ]
MTNIVIILKIGENYGGAERRFARLFKLVSLELKYRLTLIIQGDDLHINKFLVEYSLDENLIIFRSKNVISTKKIMNEIDIDILHLVAVNTSFFPLYLKLKLSKRKFKIVLSLNSYELCTGIYKNLLQKITFYLLISLVNSIDCLYPSYVNILKQRFHRINPKIKYFYPNNSFTDLEKYKPNISKDKLIVFASRLIEQKNPLIALDSIISCKSFLRDRGYRFIIAGDGLLKKKLESIVSNEFVFDIVQIVGNIDTSNIVASSRLFLSLQTIENYPSQSLLEAISSGNFIIATNVGDTKRIVKDEFGLLVDLNKESIVKAVINAIELIDNDLEMDDISKKSRDFALLNFDIKDYANHITTLWQKVDISNESRD